MSLYDATRSCPIGIVRQEEEVRRLRLLWIAIFGSVIDCDCTRHRVRNPVASLSVMVIDDHSFWVDVTNMLEFFGSQFSIRLNPQDGRIQNIAITVPIINILEMPATVGSGSVLS